MIVQLLFLLFVTMLINSLIFLFSGGISSSYPVVLTSKAPPGTLWQLLRKGASPIWLMQHSYTSKEVTLLRRKFPWIFLLPDDFPL